MIKPFYLRNPKASMRGKIAIGVMIFIIGIAMTFMLFIGIIYCIYLYFDFKKLKSEFGILKESAIKEFNNKNFKLCLECSRKGLELNNKDLVFEVLEALSLFNLKNYKDFIEIIERLNKNNKVRTDIDIQLKLGESYEILKENLKAKETYKYLQGIFPKSIYLKEKIELLSK